MGYKRPERARTSRTLNLLKSLKDWIENVVWCDKAFRELEYHYNVIACAVIWNPSKAIDIVVSSICGGGLLERFYCIANSSIKNTTINLSRTAGLGADLWQDTWYKYNEPEIIPIHIRIIIINNQRGVRDSPFTPPGGLPEQLRQHFR